MNWDALIHANPVYTTLYPNHLDIHCPITPSKWTGLELFIDPKIYYFSESEVYIFLARKERKDFTKVLARERTSRYLYMLHIIKKPRALDAAHIV